MATFSILESVKIDDPNIAGALISAIEESEKMSPRGNSSNTNFRMATDEDIVRIHDINLRRKNAIE